MVDKIEIYENGCLITIQREWKYKPGKRKELLEEASKILQRELIRGTHTS